MTDDAVDAVNTTYYIVQPGVGLSTRLRTDYNVHLYLDCLSFHQAWELHALYAMS